MSPLFSDLVHKVEYAVTELLPTDGPHDSREADAIAAAAEKVVIAVDPTLEPFFAEIAAAGTKVEDGLAELGTAVGALKSHLAKNAPAAPVEPPPITEPPASMSEEAPVDETAPVVDTSAPEVTESAPAPEVGAPVKPPEPIIPDAATQGAVTEPSAAP